MTTSAWSPTQGGWSDHRDRTLDLRSSSAGTQAAIRKNNTRRLPLILIYLIGITAIIIMRIPTTQQIDLALVTIPFIIIVRKIVRRLCKRIWCFKILRKMNQLVILDSNSFIKDLLNRIEHQIEELLIGHWINSELYF